MDEPRLTIAFEAPETDPEIPDLRVRLEAEKGEKDESRPTLDDLDAMVARARAGMSALTVLEERCSSARFVGSELEVTMAALVWPSRHDLRYDLDLPPEARPGPVTVLRKERRYKTWASGGGVIELPWRMESARPVWAHGCWDAQSLDVVPKPALRHDQARVVVEGERAGEAHGIVAVEGMAVGYRHEFTLVFGQFDAEGRPQSAEIDKVSVVARWLDEDGEEETAELDLPVPDCARELLKRCPDGFGVFSSRVEEEDVYEVAYNNCTGKMLAVRRVEAEKK